MTERTFVLAGAAAVRVGLELLGGVLLVRSSVRFDDQALMINAQINKHVTTTVGCWT